MAYDITEAAVAWLRSLGMHACTHPAKSMPDEFLTVERTGGSVEDMVDHPVLAIQAWARSEERAMAILYEIRSMLLKGDSRPRGVHHVAVESGPYPFWDEDTRCPRCQLVLDITSPID